jgi:hypothetical protein
MSKYIDCETDWLRGIITGEIKLKKCPVCDENGHVWLDDCGEAVSQDKVNIDVHEIADCMNCDGLGYL